MHTFSWNLPPILTVLIGLWDTEVPQAVPKEVDDTGGVAAEQSKGKFAAVTPKCQFCYFPINLEYIIMYFVVRVMRVQTHKWAVTILP